MGMVKSVNASFLTPIPVGWMSMGKGADSVSIKLNGLIGIWDRQNMRGQKLEPSEHRRHLQSKDHMF
jgi:hypothetical protein